MGMTWSHQLALTFEEEDILRIFIDPHNDKSICEVGPSMH